MGLLKQVFIAGQDIHDAEAGAVLSGLDGIGEADISGTFSLGAEVHEDLILNAPRRISSQLDAAVCPEGVDGLMSPMVPMEIRSS